MFPRAYPPAASLPKSEPAPIPPPDQPTQTAGQRKLHASARGPDPGPIARAATAPRGMNLELPTPPDRRGTSTPPPTPPLTQSARPAAHEVEEGGREQRGSLRVEREGPLDDVDGVAVLGAHAAVAAPAHCLVDLHPPVAARCSGEAGSGPERERGG